MFIYLRSEKSESKGDHFDNVDLDLGRFDKSRQFKIFENVFVGEKYVELSKDFDITLASQSSFDRLHWLIYVAKFWYVEFMFQLKKYFSTFIPLVHIILFSLISYILIIFL